MVLSAALLGGCSDDNGANPAGSSSATSGTGASGAGGGGGEGGGAECDAGSHRGPDGACESSLASWTDGPPLTKKRDHHVTFVAGAGASAFLYVLGGVQDNSTLLSSAERAPLGADGAVGAWSMGTQLPEGMAGHMVALVENTVIVSGGFRAGSSGQPILSDKSELAELQPDGSLGAWSEGPKMSVTRFHHAMVSSGDTLYVVGGLTGDNTDNTPVVERAVVSSDGKLGAWSLATPLPEKRSHHGLAADDAALYVTAGLKGDPAGVHTDLRDVLRAPINADGSLGEWSTVGELPATLATHSSFIHLGYLYVVGGVEGSSKDTNHVRRASIGADGILGAWEDLAPLPKARAHAHHTPVHGAFVYSAGGAVDHASMPDVFVGHFE